MTLIVQFFLVWVAIFKYKPSFIRIVENATITIIIIIILFLCVNIFLCGQKKAEESGQKSELSMKYDGQISIAYGTVVVGRLTFNQSIEFILYIRWLMYPHLNPTCSSSKISKLYKSCLAD